MIQAAIAGALAGLLIGAAAGGVVRESRNRDVFTFGDPAAVVESAANVRGGEDP